MSRPALTWMLAALALLAAPGCGGGKKAAPPPPASPGLEKTFERGPVKVTVRLDKKEPTLADRLKLELEVLSEASVKVTMPPAGTELSSFGVVDYTTSQPELRAEGRLRQTRTYVLEPFLSGKYEIPPLVFTFTRDGEPEHRLETEAIPIEVRSLLPEDARNLDIHDIAGPVDLPRPALPWPAILSAVLLTLGLAAGGWWWWRFRLRDQQAGPAPRPAHEIAFEALRGLVGEDLPGAGRIKEFYQRLSAILRRYIEDRFGVHAPGQTTEEFLSWQSRHAESALDHRHQALLTEFLKHCDLVKFAELQPSEAEIQKTFDACKAFILETQVQPPQGPPASPLTSTPATSDAL